MPELHINGSVLKQVLSKKYLGVFFTSDRSDDSDIKRELRQVYCRGNILLRKFRKCCADVKLQLFRSYCMNLYCSALWSKYKKESLHKLKVAYNNTFRLLFGIRGTVSISASFVALGLNTLKASIRKSIVNLQKTSCQ